MQRSRNNNNYTGNGRSLLSTIICRYVASAVRRSTVPEADYSRLDLASCRPRGSPASPGSSFCRCLGLAAVLASLLLNLAMSGAALLVIVRVTSRGDDVTRDDVVCALMWAGPRRCHRACDNNVTHLPGEVQSAIRSQPVRAAVSYHSHLSHHHHHHHFICPIIQQYAVCTCTYNCLDN